jgi:tetratricopeptide (TPR) repeat protein
LRAGRRSAEHGPPGAAARELFLVADFTNLTRDSALGPLVTQVVGDALAGSSRLALVGPERIAATKRRMRLDLQAPLTPAMALEIAAREEIKMVVDGSIRPAGSGLALSARIVEAVSGDVIHAATEAARDSTELLAAIRRLTEGLRRGLGESLASIRAPSGPLWSYTTRSLTALRKHQAAIGARRVGDFLRAVELNEEAIALDPDFANAYSAMAANRWYAGLPAGPTVPGLTHAVGLRDSLSDRERDVIEAFYHLNVTGDAARSIAAFRRHFEALRRFPGERGFTSELATLLALSGDLTGAEQVIEQANLLFGGRPATVNQAILARVLYAGGRELAAGRVIDEALSQVPHHSTLFRLRLAFLTDSGRYGEAHTLAAQIPRQSGLLNDLRVQAELDAVRGRFAEAVVHLRDLRDQAFSLGELGAAVEIDAAAGRLRLLGGDLGRVDEPPWANQLDSLAAIARPYLPLALLDARAGRPRRARQWLARYARELPADLQGPDRWMRHLAEATALRAAGNPTAAGAELREGARAVPLRVGMFEEPFIPLGDHPELARVHRQLGQADSAIAIYERYLTVRSLTRLTADAFERGPVLEALGVLYDERGDRARAAAYYRRFAELWRDADPSLQPRVEAARRRAVALAP